MFALRFNMLWLAALQSGVFPMPPLGYVYLADADGVFLTDADGVFLLGAV